MSHVYFTSGSTGRPKGCVVTHASLASYCGAHNAVYGVGEDTVSFVASAHTFDPFLGDLIGTWAAGGCCVFAPRQHLLARLGDLMLSSGATHLKCTPSLFGTLGGTASERDGALPRLRHVALGGEATSPAILASWAGRAAGPRLSNIYGVTECTVYNAMRVFMGPGDLPGLIGEPLPGNRLLLVPPEDEAAEGGAALAEVAPGVEGELLVAGAQVALGYMGRPELTAQRFVTHETLGRCYRTGDIFRQDDRGLCLLGRRDNQVKVRGHRIELPEVEYWLMRAAGALLREVAVAFLSGQLIAFCVPKDGGAMQKANAVLCDTLRWVAQQKVPAPMRPQRF